MQINEWIVFLITVAPVVIAGYKLFAGLHKIQETQEEIKTTLEEQSMDMLRIKILQMIHNSPNNVVAITSMFDEYTKKGGNSFVCDEFNDWKKKYMD